MHSAYFIRVANHVVQLNASVAWVDRWFPDRFQPHDSSLSPDLTLHIEAGYGRPFESFDVQMEHLGGETVYARADYRLRISRNYREARLQVYDEFALKHAVMNLYSAFIVHREWGLLIHSSCAIERDCAYLFAGRSGAGKSTVARLSAPRLLLSDEASVVCIPENGAVRVYDSPFRSDIRSEASSACYPLAAIHLLNQSDRVDRMAISGSAVLTRMMGAVFYWAHDPGETAKVIRLIERLAQSVPTYDLYFQKNDSFWGLIS